MTPTNCRQRQLQECRETTFSWAGSLLIPPFLSYGVTAIPPNPPIKGDFERSLPPLKRGVGRIKTYNTALRDLCLQRSLFKEGKSTAHLM
jgi:hypothetical protein